jgi:acid phosphatase
MSLASARLWLLWKPSWFDVRLPRFAPAAVGVWLLLLLVVKGGLAYWPTDRDTRAYWNAIKDKLPESRYELVVVNQRRHGLSFYSGGGVEWVTTKEHPYPTFYATESLEHETHELPTAGHHHVFLVRDKEYETATQLINGRGFTFQEHPAPFETKMLVCSPAPVEDWVVRLAAMGDTRSGDTGQIQLGSALYQTDEERPLDGIVLLGDNVSYYGDPEYFPETFLKPYNALLDRGVKFFATLGNHDVKGGHMDFQLNHPLLNMKGRRYYTHVFGENLVQVFFLDTNTSIADPKQMAWLLSELKKSDAPWKVVAMHVPIYGRIERRPEADLNLRARLEPIFIEHGVDIVLSGHNHVYQRIRPKNGIHYFTAGSGGQIDRGQILPDDPDLLAGNDGTNVAIILQFTGETCEFKAIDSLERVVDEGTIPYPKHTAVSYPI